MWNKSKTLMNGVEDWLSKGLITQDTAQLLTNDIITNHKTRSFGSIVMLLGVICLAFGVMTFVASNWDGMSSLSRVGILFAALWLSWSLSIWFKARGNEWTAQVFVLLACSMFGASIMLIGQIYHLQGKPKDAVWLWAIGTLIGALSTRSTPALVLSIMLFTLWSLMQNRMFTNSNVIEYQYLIYWVICALGAWWMNSRFAAHTLMLGLTFWLWYASVIFDHNYGRVDNISFLLCVLFFSFIVLSAVLYSYGKQLWLKGFEPAALTHVLILIGGLLVIWYFGTDQRYNGKWRMITTLYWPGIIGSIVTIAIAYWGKRISHIYSYDMIVVAVFTIIASILSGFIQRVPFLMEGFLLAMAIWTIRMGWRLEYRALSTWGFIGFTLVMLLIYFRTLGSLIDTSIFYLGAGVLLVAGAIIIPRLARRGGTAS